MSRRACFWFWLAILALIGVAIFLAALAVLGAGVQAS
jgi:hypothetical protein